MIWIFVIIAVLAAVFFILALGLASFVMTVKRQTLDEAFKWQSDHYDTSFYEKIDKTDYTVEGCNGYRLFVEFLKNPRPTTKYIIITHGHTDNRFGSLKYVPMYLELGFNCVIYDLRAHGVNDETNTTYGILEAKDLDLLIKDTRKRYPDITQLGLHGESLGSATTVTCMKYRPQVDFAVADCGFADLRNVLVQSVKLIHLPKFFVNIADVGIRIRYHYSIDEMRPIDALKDNEIPILFIHGEADNFILPSNSKRMAEATKGYSECHMIPKAEHAGSILMNPACYKKYVSDFLKNV